MVAAASGDGARPPSDRTLRVLMVTPRYLPDLGGIETHVYEVARRLTALEGFDITVLATDRTRRLPRDEVLDGIRVLRVPSWPPGRDYYLAPRIAAVVGQRERWDLVHCQGIHTPVPVLAMLAARRAGTPYLVTFHTGGHSLWHRNALRSTQWRLAGLLLRNAVSLVGVSRFEAQTLSEQARLRGKPVTVIRNGGTLPPPPAGTVAIPGRIVSSGRLERYKGHHRVIEALPHVIRDVPRAHLVVIGSGPYEPELRELARRLGVSDRVTITHLPPADRRAMAEALAESSVVVALSDYEAHPVAVMEALSVGRPVVGYDVAGIGELVADGWVRGVTPGAPAASAARGIVEAMSSPCLVDPAELPTWDSCADQLAQIYLASAGRLAPPAGFSSSRLCGALNNVLATHWMPVAHPLHVLIQCRLAGRRVLTEAAPSRPAPWRATTYPTARSTRKPTMANDVPAIMAKLRAMPEASPRAVSRSPRTIPWGSTYRAYCRSVDMLLLIPFRAANVALP
jgi:glycosyltransferase involved in cell wall biosynthesis